jgi:hypothetical protein
LLAFTVPIRQRISINTYYEKLCEIVDDIKEAGDVKAPLLTKDQIEDIDELESWTERVQSPLQQLEHRLHNWVAYLIMPLFAFSNAGVSFQGEANLDTFLGGVIVVSLVVGKLLGITLFSLLSIRLKLAELPEGVNFMQIIGTALAGRGGLYHVHFCGEPGLCRQRPAPGLRQSRHPGRIIPGRPVGLPGPAVRQAEHEPGSKSLNASLIYGCTKRPAHDDAKAGREENLIHLPGLVDVESQTDLDPAVYIGIFILLIVPVIILCVGGFLVAV